MRLLAIAFIALWASSTSTTAYAQTPAPAPAPPGTQDARPYRGLFGGGVGRTDQSLALTLSLTGGFDTSVQTADGGATDPATGVPLGSALQSVRTGFEQATAGLNYTLTRDRVSVLASVVANGTHYQTLAKTIMSSSGSVGAAFALTPRTSVSGTETISYQPLFFSNTFPSIGGIGISQPFLPDTTTGARLDNYENQTTGLTLAHTFSPRIGVALSYQRGNSTFSSDAGTLTQTVQGRIDFNVTRDLSFWVGDGYFDTESRSTGGKTEDQGQLASFGAAYSRLAHLSLSRHTKLALGAGLTAVSDGHGEHLGVTANAMLTYEIGRSWTAATGYRRDVAFVAFFDQPVTTDGAVAEVNGLIGRRIMIQASAGASTSTVGFGGSSNDYTTQYASASLSCGITRALALGLGYSDYRYHFDRGLDLPAGVINRSNGQTVYAFLRVWQPLFVTRSRNAAR